MKRRRRKAAIVIVALALSVLLVWAFRPKARRERGVSLVEVRVTTIAELALEYHRVFGEIPQTSSGTVDGAALLGKNPREIKFIVWKDRLSSQGELLDPWGQPFQIVLNEDGSAVTVRSAGSDGISRNDDDEIYVRQLD